jgi:hypothetical protein
VKTNTLLGCLLIVAAFAPGISSAAESAIPDSVGADKYADLLQHPPFRRVIVLSQSLVLSGVATLPGGKVVTIWDRATGRSFIVNSAPNAQGWRLLDVSGSTNLQSVTATIAAGDQTLTLKFDPDRLTPPRLDNTSKPAARIEGAVVVEALLRSLQPAVAKDFEALPPDGQESFRKAFTKFLSTYPSASDATRLAFVQRALEETRGEPQEQRDAPPVATRPVPEAARLQPTQK